MPSVPVRVLGTIATATAVVLTTGPGVAAGAAQSCAPVVPCHHNAALVHAVERANAKGSGTIRLARRCTYTLRQVFPGEYGNNALPRITGRITIDGDGAVLARAGDAPDMRILEVSGHGALTLKDTTLSNGHLDPAFSFGGDAYAFLSDARLTLVRSRLTHGFARWGGGVLSDGPLVVDHSRISHNATSFGGGGIWSHGNVLVDSSEITANAGGLEIGGIATGGQGAQAPAQTVTVRASKVSGNQGSGIAADVQTTVNVIDSTISGNTGTARLPAGGIDNTGTTTLTRSRVFGNHSPGVGGGICNGTVLCSPPGGPGLATLRLVDTSVRGNTAATDGGGIFNDSSSTVTLRRSDVHGNRPNDCAPPGTCPVGGEPGSGG